MSPSLSITESTHAKLRSLNSFVMYEVKAALESLVVGEEGEASHHPDRGGCGVPCDQHQVQCRGHQRVVQAVHSGVPPGGSNTHTGSHRPYGFRNVTALTGAGMQWPNIISGSAWKEQSWRNVRGSSSWWNCWYRFEFNILDFWQGQPRKFEFCWVCQLNTLHV